jgi:hypothetical protein
VPSPVPALLANPWRYAHCHLQIEGPHDDKVLVRLVATLILPEGSPFFAKGIGFELLVCHAKGRFLVPVPAEPVGTRLLNEPRGIYKFRLEGKTGFFCPMDRVSSP